MTARKPVVLCILDGWGLRAESKANAVHLAHTPHFDDLMAECPSDTLITYGPGVGLPNGQMGNSEVGHMNIGAGRVVEMDLRRIEGVIERNEYGALPAIQRFIRKVTDAEGTAHVFGLLSDGGVHSHLEHMIETAKVLDQYNVKTVLHLFGDGRDVAPKSAAKYLGTLKANLPPSTKIGTLCGRYFALDRDNRWDRVSQAYHAIASGKGPAFPSVADIITDAYGDNITDEFIKPSIIGDYSGMSDGDGILFLNFRADRAREILSALADPDFDDFETGPRAKLSIVSGFTEYSERHSTYMDCVFPSEQLTNTLGEWVEKQGRSQFRIAETEKYPHVTFFFNGGIEDPSPHEDRYLAPSPKVATYDLQPEMSSVEVTDNLVAAIDSDQYDLIVVNYANPDMVGHTGDLNAAIAACASVDVGLGQVVDAVHHADGALLVCADHGNCETMVDPVTGEPHTAHTTNPVPVILIGGPKNAKLRQGGKLADVAPTLLSLMGLPQPVEMTGISLIEI
jgi:2,3-bisphosphoglycerate-independent phosphoglycerate mutase